MEASMEGICSAAPTQAGFFSGSRALGNVRGGRHLWCFPDDAALFSRGNIIFDL